MIKAGIIGGAGYTGGELIRILMDHPQVEIAFVHSNSHAGKPLYSAHPDLFGDTGMIFTNEISPADVLFFCMGHNKSAEFMNAYPFAPQTKIIDLSHDFRINPFFQTTDGRNLEFVYGLPECNKNQIEKADYVANPGCFATAFELALLPLAKAGLLTDKIHVNGITGSTGAGQAATPTTHFSWRNNNISVYNAFTHRHLKEVRKLLEITAGNSIPDLNFLPVRGDFTRGIFLTAYTNTDKESEEVTSLYKEYYAGAAFTFVSDGDISLKEVVNTNKCLLRVEKYGNKVLITSVIDNLIKGASGQAVQNMNLMFGLDEKAGLNLKASAF